MQQDTFLSKIFSALIGRILVTACRLLTGVKARWQGCEPSVKTRIYYANHASHLDGLVIWAGMPTSLRHKVHPVAARDYWDKTALRRYLAQRVFRAVLIERQANRTGGDPLAPLSDMLEKGESLIFFPEGTRGSGEGFSEFKSGLYHLARRHPDVELVPVYLENLNRVLPKGSRLVVPVICSAIFGAPLPGRAEAEDKAAFLTRARQAMEALTI